MANEFVIKNGYFSQGNSNVTGSLQVTGSVGVTGSVSITQNLTASKTLISSSGNEQLMVIGSGSDSWLTGIYGSQGNLLTVTDTFSGSIFTVTDISGYPILDVTSDYYTSSVYLPTLQSQSQQNVIVYNSQSGLLSYVSASAIGGGSGDPFPYTGSAEITGSLIVSGGFIVHNTSVGFNSIDSNNTNLIDTAGITSLSWSGRELNDTVGTPVLNWGATSLYDTGNDLSLVWGDRTLINSAGVTVGDWEAQRFWDATGNRSLDWNARILYDSAANPVFDWNTPGEIIVTDDIIPGGPYVNNTSSYNLGSPTAAWDKIYVSNNSLHFVSGSVSASIGFNNGVISFNNAIVDIPTGSTVPTSSFAVTSSYATTASYALNAAQGLNTTASFVSSTSWTFTHNLNNRYPIIQTLDSNFNQIIPQNIELTDANTATITFPVAISGYAIASLGGSNITQINNTASSVFATTGSNTFRGTQTFSGSLIPAGPYTDNTSSYDLGSATAAWRDLYVSNGSIKMISGSNSASIQFNGNAVTFTGAAVTLPSSSTVPTSSIAATASTVFVVNEPSPFIPQVRYLTYVYSTGSNQSLISTGSLQYNHISNTIFATASIAATASSVNTLNQNVIITGSVAIGTGSIGNGENNLLLGPAPAGGAGEGGQIALLAAGGSYTSSSFIDNWQNQFRILRGPGAVSNAGLMYMDLQTGNTNFIGAVTASAYSGLPNAWLHAMRSGNQTIGSGTWADRDIIFNSVSSNNFTYNSTTGIATLKAGKTYRITARLAWSAAGLYTLKFRIYNQTTSAFTGPTVELIQSPNGTYNVSDGTLEMIFNVGASDTDISIRTTADTNALTGEYIRGDLNTQLIIQQII